MDYELYAKEVIALYPISNPQIEFIRHNENITYKVTDTLRRKAYLLRIHRPVNDGMYGDQHTFKGLKSEVKILQDLSSNLELKIQKPVANLSGEYVTAYNLPGLLSPCFSTVIEWIEGSPLTLEEDNIEEMCFVWGKS